MNSSELKVFLRKKAEEYGFSDMKIAKAEHLEEESIRLRKWLDEGRHGTMGYMENHFEKRTDPTKLLPETKSIAVFAYNYYTDEDSLSSGKYKLARYAYGKDYHKLIRKKLRNLLRDLQEEDSSLEGRAFVDSAPILERDLARRSGLGWTGKNTLTINPKRGSYFFIASIFLNRELAEDDPISDFCGTCRRCIDACPTSAIDQKGYLMDGSKCISYLTIENKSEEIDAQYADKMEGWIFGCDVCQEVCPWNRFSTTHHESAFMPNEHLKEMKEEDWTNLDQEKFDLIFSGSAIKRTKFKGLKRNINFISDHG